MSIENMKKSAEYIRNKINTNPRVGLILGSGLGVLAEEVNNSLIIPYSEIPGFPVSTVEGHAGQLVVGILEGIEVVVMQGRFHYYEGYDMDRVTYPVRVMKLLGIENIIITNAAGGINNSFEPGDLMIITDHINMFGTSPLIGKNYSEFGTRFPDMSNAYHRDYINLAESIAKKLEIKIQKGVYIGNTGPNYETPAEIRMGRILGGDAVGMSTVPEVIVANHCGMKVLGISCISNMAAGILDQPLSHDEVMETTEKVKSNFLKLVKSIVQQMG
ncbi:MAG: purine-nucleoside phosphorylase [Bacillales bacterium]|jgi:purine-nucleoside phosphorylase|nr:purine-nucleoside phosphorylase [Bacillales bacterium]